MKAEDPGNKFLVVVNPNAGGRLGERDWPAIEKILTDSGLDFEPVFTKYRHHAIKLTEEKIAEGFRKIIVVGGDGTINEVVNGIFARKNTAEQISMGVIMIGTGNDWGRMFDIPADYAEAVELIKNGREFIQDVGCVSYFLGDSQHKRYFINTAGIGFDALVVENTNKSKDKGKSGKFSYLITLFKTLMKYKTLDISVMAEGRPLAGNRLFTMSIGIGKYSGGGMQQVPGAVVDDGLFDVMLVNKISKAKIIYKIKKLYDGRIGELKEVDLFRGRSIRVESKDKVMLEVDGESLGHAPFEFEVIDEKLKVIVK